MCPSERRIRAHRLLVVSFPDRDEDRAGVMMTMSMTQNLKERPVSGASAAEISDQLGEIRTRTLRLTESLSDKELMGPTLDRE